MTRFTCASNIQQTHCGVMHHTKDAAEKHSERMNNLHNHKGFQGVNRPYCPACDGGAYLDYKPLEMYSI